MELMNFTDDSFDSLDMLVEGIEIFLVKDADRHACRGDCGNPLHAVQIGGEQGQQHSGEGRNNRIDV